MNSTDNLLAKLLELKATWLPPPSVREVSDTEITLEARFPKGILEFYQFSNGVKENTQELDWHFYSLEHMINRTTAYRKQHSIILYEGEVLPYRDFVCFCDVLIELNIYVFCGNPESVNFGKFYGIQEDIHDNKSYGWLVANTYEEFIQVFLRQNGEPILEMQEII